MLEVRIPFQDRRDAEQALVAPLTSRGMECTAVLGLVRGGVPVALEVASALETHMDVLVLKKLRAPMQQELAIGAICTDGAHMLRQGVIWNRARESVGRIGKRMLASLGLSPPS